jgi:hypothetical protein
MRATPTRRLMTLRGFAVACYAAVGVSFVFGAAGCGGSTPMDMWISKDPDAGSGFEAPVREVQPADTGDDSAGTGGAAGSGGAGGDTGTAGAGGNGGDMGAGGASGNGGASAGGAGGGSGAGGAAAGGAGGTGG